jgi:AhpD family alkylhydroperoxidase
LSTKVTELIALGIAIAARSDCCISYHIHDALGAGASHEEIMEAVGVAVLMGGAISAVYGAEALEALRQFEVQGVASGRRDRQIQREVKEVAAPARWD